jgi:hypothetical protein
MIPSMQIFHYYATPKHKLFNDFSMLTAFELMLARQVLSHLSHSTSPVLCWVFFEIGSRELYLGWT